MVIWLRILIGKSTCSLQVRVFLFASELIFGSLAHSCLLRAVEQTLDVEEALDTILQVVLAGRHVVGMLFCLACRVIAICRWRRINRIRRLQPSMPRNKE